MSIVDIFNEVYFLGMRLIHTDISWEDVGIGGFILIFVVVVLLGVEDERRSRR